MPNSPTRISPVISLCSSALNSSSSTARFASVQVYLAVDGV